MVAKKSLGQHFLVDPNLQRKIVDAAEIREGDRILEVGPGRGALTRHLVETPLERLFGVELDHALAAALAEAYGDRERVEVLQGDILELDRDALGGDPASLKVIGNIPYRITTPLLFRLLERPRPRLIVVTVQKEVAMRITAEPGTSSYGALAVGIQSVARARRLFDVSRHAFRPVPGVDSTVIRIRPLDPPPLTREEEEGLRSLTRAAFQWRRKQFQTTLRKHPRYRLSRDEVAAVEEETGFDLRRRPERFSPRELLRLAGALEARGRPRRPGP